MIGVDKTDCFQHLIDRVNQRINGWKEKTLSYGGKEVLLKFVAQSIPTYAMSVFKLPKQICKGVTDVSHFLWGDEDDHKRIHWMAWWKMCVPKFRVGMGFRDIFCFNLALLAKQCWQLISNEDSVRTGVLRAKYFPDGNILDVPLKKNASYAWQSIWAVTQPSRKDVFGG